MDYNAALISAVTPRQAKELEASWLNKAPSQLAWWVFSLLPFFSHLIIHFIVWAHVLIVQPIWVWWNGSCYVPTVLL
jgi:hypothetical protein